MSARVELCEHGVELRAVVFRRHRFGHFGLEVLGDWERGRRGRNQRQGAVANVVFPTGIDQRLDLGQPDRIDVYYGMADSRIGVARLDMPEQLPLGANADPLRR